LVIGYWLLVIGYWLLAIGYHLSYFYFYELNIIVRRKLEFQNIVLYFENQERAYCDYFIDLATLTDNNFFKMTDSSATEYGFYFDDMYGDGYYTFIVVVK
jgi:hypothetical protein